MLDNLRLLCLIRLIVQLAMILALSAAWVRQLPLPYLPLGVILLLSAGINALSWWRTGRTWSVTEIEFLLQILVDILGLGLLLYFSGGATNPFISYFLVPLSISAATLPWRFTWFLALLCIGIYSLLLLYHQPLAIFDLHMHGAPRINLHIIGMWANFALSALLITAFVVRMAQALRDRDTLLNKLREDDLRDEQVLAVATLAAGTAHELGTPLSTLKILLDELRAEYRQDQHLSEDLTILAEQVDICRSTLKRLVAAADRENAATTAQYPAVDFFEELFGDWRLMHPEAPLELVMGRDLDRLTLSGDATLKPALNNLLNNSLRASPEGIAVSVYTETEGIVMQILDSGGGVPAKVAEQLGKPVVFSSEDGLGIGLLLTHATLNRFGGHVTLYSRPEGGTRTVAKLPAIRTRPT